MLVEQQIVRGRKSLADLKEVRVAKMDKSTNSNSRLKVGDVIPKWISENECKLMFSIRSYSYEGFKLDHNSLNLRISGDNYVYPTNYKIIESDLSCTIEIILSNEEVNTLINSTRTTGRSATVYVTAYYYDPQDPTAELLEDYGSSYSFQLFRLDNTTTSLFDYQEQVEGRKSKVTTYLYSGAPYEIVNLSYTEEKTGAVCPTKRVESDYVGPELYNGGNYLTYEVTLSGSLEVPHPDGTELITYSLIPTVTIRHIFTGEEQTFTTSYGTDFYFSAESSAPLDSDYEDFEWTHVSNYNLNGGNMSSQIINYKNILYMFDDYGYCQRYDTKRRTALRTTTMAKAPEESWNSSVVAWEDKIYLIGGRYYSTVQIYDIKENSWTLGQPVPCVDGPGANKAFAYEGKIYMWSGEGCDSVDITSIMYVYDIANDSWEKLTSPYALAYYFAEIIDDNIYYCGGYDQNWDETGQLYIYNITNNTWTLGGVKPVLSNYVLYSSGGCVKNKLLMLGGVNGYHHVPMSYNIRTQEFLRVPSLPTDLLWTYAACACDNKEIYMISDRTGRLYRLASKDDPFLTGVDSNESPRLEEEEMPDDENNSSDNINSRYNKTIWSNGDVIIADGLNKIENQLELISSVSGSNYSKTSWVDGDVITSALLNKIENQLESLNSVFSK